MVLTSGYRYFAMSVLDHIQRSKALAEWHTILKGKQVPLERALGAFDLFVLHDKRGDFEEVRASLDGTYQY
jgi:F-box protein 21